MIASLAPAGAAVAVEAVARPGGPQADHEAGRRAATRALAALGIAGEAAGNRGSRPRWPEGTTGSISHAAGWATAVAAKASEWSALGIDIEQTCGLPAADALVVCTTAERALLADLDAGDARDRWATLIWVAKEAAYKAYETWTGGLLNGIDPVWLDVRCRADGSASSGEDPGLGSPLKRLRLPRLAGRWAEGEGVVAVVLAAR